MLNHFLSGILSSSNTSIVDYLNPLRYMSHEQYILIWRHLFDTILHGFWAKLLASGSLFLAFFFGVYRQRVVMGITLYFVSILIAYGGFIIKMVFSL